ncbi:hypothetical protein N7448_000363 [Penicillium atrosanguineum]|uniref:HAD-like domain-containing protein n=1 Tax=Penicillium atrosanguineum TaxID=1132637 RepID=A0A9W9Q5B7_9EURO|nr:Acetolactate synthase [Penicillium atrosanguineum]KAJ5134617.1 hypothetical protein N7526_005982 [Penicillium atrosanguineum]KAJ5148785.1 hypothetical protein N7448_000363 [Penicillium atrosanguineum]KAJ5304100.1 Acetolactate synthase [Penicillium atrosanguineum]KAJ5323577.1 hypothetical protein N7476_002177 [Penicillium atrosanguineum]
MSTPNPHLQAILAKKWFGFDLDDTLHEFRKASTKASMTVFEAIHKKFGINMEALEVKYQEILQTSTANAFTDGRTSTDYRRERFTQLLEAHLVDDPIEDTYINNLLEIYQSSLRSNLTLKAGALGLLQTLRRLGKKVIVITEGPADAQEWTAQELGLWSYIDILVTTNGIGKSKVDGLFGVVFEKYGISADEIVYFGDNEVRDVKVAQGDGILAVLYDEKQRSQLDDCESLRIDSWEFLALNLEPGV